MTPAALEEALIRLKPKLDEEGLAPVFGESQYTASYSLELCLRKARHIGRLEYDFGTGSVGVDVHLLPKRTIVLTFWQTDSEEEILPRVLYEWTPGRVIAQARAMIREYQDGADWYGCLSPWDDAEFESDGSETILRSGMAELRRNLSILTRSVPTS
ncbi:MAG: hypothetical protein KIS66_10500 [Fimbriimonadaceae bacterium]|nr:hypothetical protein [Fimbriimonadaceae bacterium]